MVHDIMHHLKQIITDDTRLSNRQVEDWIRNTRAAFIQQSLTRGGYPTNDFKQSLGCVEMQVADWSECCDVEVGCSILRSVKALPIPIYSGSQPLITRVATVGVMKKNITMDTQERAISSGSGRFSKEFLFGFLKDNYLYVTSHNSPYKASLEHITVEGVWDTPEQAAQFSHCDGTPCYTHNSRYPISRTAYEWMKEKIIATDFPSQAQAQADTTNNAKDDTIIEV